MKKIGILLEDLFDEKELIYPYFRLLEAGYEVDLIAGEAGKTYRGKSGLGQVSSHASKDVGADDYLGLIIPGGYSPDYMRRCQATKELVGEMDRQGKLVAAICHGPWMMASACDIEGKNMTAFFSIKDDLINAGANYLDQEVVVDGNLITSRTTADLPAFLRAILEKLEGAGA